MEKRVRINKAKINMQAEESKAQGAQAAAAEDQEEEKKEEEDDGPVTAKHQALANEAGESVELIQNTHTQNVTSVFVNQRKSWDDENDFTIPPEIIRGILEMDFIKPSHIQAVAIPMITNPVTDVYHDLIAQSKNGSGKTGAFAIGTTLRVDPSVMKPQVLVLAHFRELSAQIADVYGKICKYSNINVTNFSATGKTDAHIIVTTLGKLANSFTARGNKSKKLDLSALKCIVFDETDVFFGEQRSLKQLKEIHAKYISKLP